MPSDDGLLTELIDRECIRDCLMRYARGIDRRDADVLTSVYWPDATDDHVSFKGSATEFIAWVIPLLGGLEQTMHTLGNILIELHGSIAKVETYFTAYHRMPSSSVGAHDMVLGGRYLDKIQKRGGEWRILEREVVCDWSRDYPDSADWAKGVMGGPAIFRTNRKPDDHSYVLFG